MKRGCLQQFEFRRCRANVRLLSCFLTGGCTNSSVRHQVQRFLLSRTVWVYFSKLKCVPQNSDDKEILLDNKAQSVLLQRGPSEAPPLINAGPEQRPAPTSRDNTFAALEPLSPSPEWKTQRNIFCTEFLLFSAAAAADVSSFLNKDERFIYQIKSLVLFHSSVFVCEWRQDCIVKAEEGLSFLIRSIDFTLVEGSDL